MIYFFNTSKCAVNSFEVYIWWFHRSKYFEAMKAGKLAIRPWLSCQYNENTLVDLPSSMARNLSRKIANSTFKRLWPYCRLSMSWLPLFVPQRYGVTYLDLRRKKSTLLFKYWNWALCFKNYDELFQNIIINLLINYNFSKNNYTDK